MPGWRLVALPLALLSALVVVLSGCAGQHGAVSDPSSLGDEPAAGDPADQGPVKVNGLESCGSIALLAGDRAPVDGGFKARRLDCLTRGPSVDLAGVRGKPVVVNLWASWCGPCRKEAPVLQRGYARHGAEVAFVGVDTRDAGPPAAGFLTEFHVTYPQMADPKGALLGQLRVPGLPVTVVLDTDGRIAARHIGPLDRAELDELISQVLR